MSLLKQHVAEIKSNEIVLGVSGGFKGEAGSRFEGIESTKITVLAESGSKNWIGFTTIDQSIADASVGASLVGKEFPASCLVTYRRVAGTEKRLNDGVQTTKDVEKLLVVKIEYLCAADIVEKKLPKAA